MSRRGGAWEGQLARLHDRYRRDRKATILRAHPGVRMVADRGKTFVATWEGQGPPDFIGWLAGGRAVAFDAKRLGRGQRFPLRMVARHQARDLEACMLAGGLAFIAFRLGADTYVLPWRDLGPLYWAWHEKDGPISVAHETWWRAFDIAGDGWIAVVEGL